MLKSGRNGIKGIQRSKQSKGTDLNLTQKFTDYHASLSPFYKQGKIEVVTEGELMEKGHSF